jgi:hypothetical protein
MTGVTRNHVRRLAIAGWLPFIVAAAPEQTPPVEMRELLPGMMMPFRSLAPGLPAVPDYGQANPPPLPVAIPEGFTPIFNGRDLAGWHISATSRHGTKPTILVRQGAIVALQGDVGQGGLLITDKSYSNFELSLDVKPDWGADSGIFFRTTESGAAYQIQLDYVSSDKSVTMSPGLNLGGIVGEGGVTFGAVPATSPKLNPADLPPHPAPDYADPPVEQTPSFWKREAWNNVRVRVEGTIPHVRVWINGVLVSDRTDTANHAVGGMVSGPIALQVHGGWQRWRPASVLRFRNIAIKVLPE